MPRYLLKATVVTQWPEAELLREEMSIEFRTKMQGIYLFVFV
jgi:hypothetical protein